MFVSDLSFDRLRLASADARVGRLASVATDDHARGQLVVVASGMAVGKLGVARYELCTDIQIETSAAECRSVDGLVPADVRVGGLMDVPGKMLEGSQCTGHHDL